MPDRKRFVMVRFEPTAIPSIDVIFNWLTNSRKRFHNLCVAAGVVRRSVRYTHLQLMLLLIRWHHAVATSTTL